MIKLKRVYEDASSEDGMRILVDRLWPRGISKERAKLDEWLKGLAPTTELRKWFAHDPKKWTQFQKKYRKELAEHKDELSKLKKLSRGKTVTLLYGAKDTEHNEAVVIKAVLAGK